MNLPEQDKLKIGQEVSPVIIDGAGTDKGDVLRVINPEGGMARHFGANRMGAIKITFPINLDNYATFSMTVDIFGRQWNTNPTDSALMHIVGRSNSDKIEEFSVSTITQNEATNYPVRFGNDGTNYCIWIGEANHNWDQVSVGISNLYVARATDYGEWYGAFNTTITPTFDTVQLTLTDNLPVAKNSGGTGDQKPPVDETYADVTALLADQNNQELDYFYEVTDASGFSSISSGAAVLLYNASTPTGTESDYVIIWSENEYEPAFEKNSGFNKDFGFGSDNVLKGSDFKINSILIFGSTVPNVSTVDGHTSAMLGISFIVSGSTDKTVSIDGNNTYNRFELWNTGDKLLTIDGINGANISTPLGKSNVIVPFGRIVAFLSGGGSGSYSWRLSGDLQDV